MQYAIFPGKNLRETQAIGGSYSHKGTFALDDGGKDTGIDNIYAPCDLVVVAKGSKSYGFVYYQSINPVLLANGSVNYINFRLGHDNDISNIRVGQKFKQFDVIYQEGKAGANGNHIHLQVAIGKYRGIYKNIYSHYMLFNEARPDKVFVLLKGYTNMIKTTANWKWVDKPNYIAPATNIYKGSSIVDYLKSIGVNSSFSNRKKLATNSGIRGYIGTATQNKLLLKKLRGF